MIHKVKLDISNCKVASAYYDTSVLYTDDRINNVQVENSTRHEHTVDVFVICSLISV